MMRVCPRVFVRSVLAGVCPKTGNEYRESITILGKKTRERSESEYRKNIMLLGKKAIERSDSEIGREESLGHKEC